MGPKSDNSVLIRDEGRDRHVEKPCADKGGDQSDAATARECSETTGAERGKEGSSPRTFRASSALLRLLASGTVREPLCVVGSHPSHGDLLWQPCKPDTGGLFHL